MHVSPLALQIMRLKFFPISLHFEYQVKFSQTEPMHNFQNVKILFQYMDH